MFYLSQNGYGDQAKEEDEVVKEAVEEMFVVEVEETDWMSWRLRTWWRRR